MRARSSAARRYAQAAFDVARGDDALERWASDLRVAATVAAHEDVAKLLENPGIPYERRRHALERALGDIDPKVRNLAVLLLQRRRVDQLPRVADAFQALVDRHNGILTGTATSAAALTDDEAARVRRQMEELTGSQVKLVYRVDPGLIGGVIVRIGDRLYDGSVRGRLERLRTKLTSQTA